ncbi:MAG: hypothetical protein ACRD2X_16855 [Vicinamibacteraceae bacterium]
MTARTGPSPSVLAVMRTQHRGLPQMHRLVPRREAQGIEQRPLAMRESDR